MVSRGGGGGEGDTPPGGGGSGSRVGAGQLPLWRPFPGSGVHPTSDLLGAELTPPWPKFIYRSSDTQPLGP